MSDSPENTVDISQMQDSLMDTSISDAKWLLGSVVFIAVCVLATGVVANTLAG